MIYSPAELAHSAHFRIELPLDPEPRLALLIIVDIKELILGERRGKIRTVAPRRGLTKAE